MSRCVANHSLALRLTPTAQVKEKPMFAYRSIHFERPQVRNLRISHADPIEVGALTHQADLARCKVLFIDYDDWVAAHLYERGIVIDSPARTKAFIEQEAPELLKGGGGVYVARLDGRRVGVSALMEASADVAEVTRLYVSGMDRRRGVARCLVERVIEDARASGYRTLQARVLSFMTDARQVYEAAGFRQTQQLDSLTTLMVLELRTSDRCDMRSS
jgi:GNAT superfamily N-acetyltransferase